MNYRARTPYPELLQRAADRRRFSTNCQFAEAELTLFCPRSSGGSERHPCPGRQTTMIPRVAVHGTSTARIVAREPLLVRLEGIGRKGSAIEDLRFTAMS